MNLAITGSSGNIGGMVARHLNTRGLPLILPLRNPAKAPNLTNCEARRFAYGDLELAKQALNGVDVLFMVSAAESPTREQEHLTLVQAASEAGVKHIVYLSFAQAALDSTFTLARTHAVTENAIRQTNMRYTFLRDNFYSEMMATIANADGIIAGPADDGRVACVSQRDVAQATANIIADIACDNHHYDNQTYTLTGSQSLSFVEIAAVLTDRTATTMKLWKKPSPAAKLSILTRPIGRLKPGFLPTLPLPKASLLPFQTTCRSCWDAHRLVLKT